LLWLTPKRHVGCGVKVPLVGEKLGKVVFDCFEEENKYYWWVSF